MRDELRDRYLLLPQQAESLHHLPIEWQVFLENFQKGVIQPVIKAFQTMAEAIRPTLKPLVEAIRSINEVVYASYLADGAIYGETQDGYLRWLKECAEMERLRMQSEHLRQHQESACDFKRMLRAKQVKKLEEDHDG